MTSRTPLTSLFERLNENPAAVFSGSELRESGNESFSAFVETGVLVPELPAVCVVRGGRRVLVRELEDGTWEGLDEEDVEFGILLESGDVERWSVDVACLAHMVATENELGSDVSQLSQRLWFLGPCALHAAAVLAFLPSGDQALAELRTLPSLLPRRWTRAVVLSASPPVPLSWQKELEGLGIETGVLDLPSLKAVPALRTTSRRLSADVAVGVVHQPSGLTLSPDLRRARLGGREWKLSFTCGRAVEFMLRALNQGQPELHQAAILEAAESSTSDLSTLFHRTDAIGTLIVPGGSAGFYRLNV